MNKIYELTPSFVLSRRYVMFMFKRYFRKIEIIGKENIPVSGPVIFAPNHTNALMDALAIHYFLPRKFSLVFLARADIFQNKIVAGILRFARIMPAFRMRDGYENLEKNKRIFEECVEILQKGYALGIMPEGNQEVEKKIRPIVKGIFRIAFTAQSQSENDLKIKIVPVGLDFADTTRANKHLIINIGQPIEVSDYMEIYSKDAVSATNLIRNKLREDLESLSIHLKTKENYEALIFATDVISEENLKVNGLIKTILNQFEVRKNTALFLSEYESKNPLELADLVNNSNEYDAVLKSKNLRNENIEMSSNWVKIVFQFLILTLFSPVFLLSLITNFLPFFSPVLLRKYVFKSEFEGFFSSLQFGLGLITFPLFYMIQTILISVFVLSNSWIVILLVPVQYYLLKFGLVYYSLYKKTKAQIAFEFYRKFNADIINNAFKLKSELIEKTRDLL